MRSFLFRLILTATPLLLIAVEVMAQTRRP